MSCRRSDKTNLIGCRIGLLQMSRGRQFCCHLYETCQPRQPEDYSPHLQIRDYATTDFARQYPPPHGKNRTGLRFDQCEMVHRPKFICPQKKCRRMVKPFYDPDRLEGHYKDGCLTVRPTAEANPVFAEALRSEKRNWFHQKPKNKAEREKKERLSAFSARIPRYWLTEQSNDPLTKDELAELRMVEPEAWDVRLIWNGEGVLEEGDLGHAKRCPSCGGAVMRVGSTFRIPAKRDEKGWREVEKMIAEGVDMVARFQVCATVKEWEGMREKAEVFRRENEVPTLSTSVEGG